MSPDDIIAASLNDVEKINWFNNNNSNNNNNNNNNNNICNSLVLWIKMCYYNKKVIILLIIVIVHLNTFKTFMATAICTSAQCMGSIAMF